MNMIRSRLRRKPKVFISSTIYDLKDARGSLKFLLESYGLRVFASESYDFPLMVNQHSYEICLRHVRDSDLVIALIDKRYGGEYENYNGTKISVTRKEIRVAEELDIPVWTFVRSQTWEERNKFKKFVKQKQKDFGRHVLSESLFDEFRKVGQTEVDSHYVYELIDEITRFKKSNWIFNNFDSSSDLLRVVEEQLGYFLPQFFNDVTFPLNQRISPCLLSNLHKYIDLSNRYHETNLRSLAAYTNLITNSNPGSMLDFRDTLDDIFNQFSNDYVTRLDNLDNTSRLLVTDTTLEYLNPETWRSSKYHKRILNGSNRLAKKLNLKYTQYVRVMLFYNPIHLLTDDEWIKSFEYLIKFHRRTRIGLGICSRSVLPFTFDDTFLNFYLVPGQVLSLWSPSTAMAFDVTKSDSPSLLDEYSDLYDLIIAACDNRDSAIWLDPNMPIQDIISEFSQLFSIE